MIALRLPAVADAEHAFIARLRVDSLGNANAEYDARLISENGNTTLFAGSYGLFEVHGATAHELKGDVVLIEPSDRRAERLLRAGSRHNTLLVTERCDQLCVMCSQPPKKTHVDRFALFTKACLVAEPDTVIGLSGGEPTLFKAALLDMVETVLTARPDLRFHILSNGQHFEADDVSRLRQPLYRHVQWGIPLYSADLAVHDAVVAKPGAFARLHDSFAHLIDAGACVELRTVVLQTTIEGLPQLARHVTATLGFINSWSIMQLESIGFAKGRWHALYVDHRHRFEELSAAIDIAALHGVPVRLFNFARCSVPPAYRSMAATSISDWKRKYPPGCDSCREQSLCTGFFEWHPDNAGMEEVNPL